MHLLTLGPDLYRLAPSPEGNRKIHVGNLESPLQSQPV